MEKPITYVGLDVHKDTIAIALAEADKRGEVFRDSSDRRSATLADGRSDWPTVGLALPSV